MPQVERSFRVGAYIGVTTVVLWLVVAGVAPQVWSSYGALQAGVQQLGSLASNVLPTGYVLTPFGPVASKCVHQVSNDSAITPNGFVSKDGAATNLAPCESSVLPYSGNGWIEYASFYYSPPSPPALMQLYSTFTVPNAPSSNGALIYLFDGLQPTPSSGPIIQPVLQWGTSPAGGGNYYGIASWVVFGNGNYAVTPVFRVYPGDSIFGIMYGGPPANNACNVNTGSCNWLVNAEDLTPPRSGASMVLSCKAFQQTNYLCGLTMYWAAVTLEAYGVTSCSQYPSSGSTTFTGTYLEDTNGNSVGATWSGTVLVGGCGAAVHTSQPNPPYWTIQLVY